MKEIEIGKLDIKPHEPTKETFRLALFELKDSSRLTLPGGLVSEGKGEGPLVCVTAAQHGDEWNGTYASHLLYESLEPAQMKGTVVIIPIANPIAFNQRTRVSSLDYVDMNRAYRFVKKRKPTEHCAKLLFEKIYSQSDYVFDLHSGGPGEYLPQVEVIKEERLELALQLNLGHLMIVKKEFNSLVPNCEERDIPSFSIEAGRAGAINYDFAERISKGIVNFLKFIGVVTGPASSKKTQKIFSKKEIIPAKFSGFFHSRVKLGEQVRGGMVLGEVTSLFGERKEKIRVPREGTVVYLRREEVIGEGESIAHIAFSS